MREFKRGKLISLGKNKLAANSYIRLVLGRSQLTTTFLLTTRI